DGAQPGIEPVNRVAEYRVDDPEEAGEDENGDDNDESSGLDFFPGGGDDLSHFGADVAKEVAAARDEAKGSVGNAVVGIHDRCFGHGSFLLVRAFLCDGHGAQLLKLMLIWQGRRDSNPQVRFWRPTV